MQAKERLVAALDVPSPEEALNLADRISPHVGWLKVGLELFVRAGPDVVSRLASRAPIFLDLKLHDIPATVSRAVRAAAALDVGMLTVHTSGGGEMMRAAAEAAGGLDLLGVTVLTSLDQEALASVGTSADLKEVVGQRATLAVSSGCAGVVASPQEASLLRTLLGPEALIVTPGVRPKGAADGDQRRIATPASAIASGADLVVVGRPIRDASDPAAAARDIVADIEAGLESK